MLTQGMNALAREIALFKLRKATHTRIARLTADRVAAHETWRSLAAAMLEPVATAAGSSARNPAGPRVRSASSSRGRAASFDLAPKLASEATGGGR